MGVTVAEDRAIDHAGAQHAAGRRLDVQDRLAQKGLERQLVMRAKGIARQTTKKSS